MAGPRLLLVLLLAALVGGCGWQLRGAGGGGIEGVVLRLEGDAEPRVLRLAEAELLDLGAEVVGADSTADAVLVVTDAGSRRRTASVDERGRAREYELTYRIGFRVEPPAEEAEEPSLPAQAVTTSSSFTTDPLDTQAADAREAQLADELQLEAVRLMIARVARAL